MSIVDGRWVAPFDTGDERRYPNYLDARELDELLARRDFDLVIVGGGGSGAVAAIEAFDLGGSSLILEQSDAPGGSTQVSGGTIRLVKDRAGAVEHLSHLAQGATPRAVIEAFVEGLTQIEEWVADHGAQLAVREEAEGGSRSRVFPISRPGSSFPNFPAADALGLRALVPEQLPGRATGAALWDLLAANLATAAVPVALGARVTRLVQGRDRQIVGVEVALPDGPRTVTARSGVILCCGGFAHDDELMTQYYGLPLPTVCPPGRATGDGVRLALDAGADLWHMNGVAASVGYRLPGLDAGIQAKMPAFGFVMVDQLARRYVCETSLENHSAIFAMTSQDAITGEYLRTPSFVVLDERTRLAGTLAHLPHGANRHYPWSADNAAEIERGWIQRAASIAELAGRLGLEADALSATVEEFNTAVATGRSDSVGRAPEFMAPILEPPFYGAPVYPIIVNTQGGPRRNERGAILRPDGTPIAGLFGAGELGSVWNRLYPGAANICEVIVSGRLAARSALQR